jgi:hypothetical protein
LLALGIPDLPDFSPKISIASHENPWHPLFTEDETGKKKAGAAQDPEQGE